MNCDNNGEEPGDGGERVASDPIMSQLKTIYDEVAEKPLPQDLVALLEKLDEAERNR